MSLTVTDPYRSEFITVTEAAEELRVTERYIRKLIANGDLSAVNAAVGCGARGRAWRAHGDPHARIVCA